MKVRIITIGKLEGDTNGSEKVRVYQKDGTTVQLAVGVPQKLPPELFWVAERAKEIGDIESWIDVDER